MKGRVLVSTSVWELRVCVVRLTLVADTELWGEPSRDALTEGPGGLSLSVEDERLGSEHKKQSICCRTLANNAAIVWTWINIPQKATEYGLAWLIWCCKRFHMLKRILFAFRTSSWRAEPGGSLSADQGSSLQANHSQVPAVSPRDPLRVSCRLNTYGFVRQEMKECSLNWFGAEKRLQPEVMFRFTLI